MIKEIIDWVLMRKEESKDYPSEFAVVKISDIAKENGLNDNHNKVIVRYKNGVEVQTIPYTDEDLKNLIEIYEIPVIDEKLEEDYDYDEENNFGEVINPKR